jgi:dTDP-4-amino-4,6-dideoxygalactose transaminase
MEGFANPIYVTRPALPSLATFTAGLQEIWSNRRLTNHGPILQRFDANLRRMLQVHNLNLFTNGTLALVVALKGLRLTGEVITTPFTFVATANALVHCGLSPVFADIEPHHLTLDPDRVEALITPRTSAILAVHVFGLPCRIECLARIAARHHLVLIYDAAHAFGLTMAGRSIADYGDVTMFSFHATKLYHSFEGGALTFKDSTLGPVFDALCNHGLEPDGDVRMVGLNAKMTEVQALMGELMLEIVEPSIAHGQRIEAIYRQRFAPVPGIEMLPEPPPEVRTNHSFVPILINRDTFGMSANELKTALLRYNVHVRRYFTPLISDMTAFRGLPRPDPLRVAARIAPEVIALPTYADLALSDVHRICDLVAGLHPQGDSHVHRT